MKRVASTELVRTGPSFPRNVTSSGTTGQPTVQNHASGYRLQELPRDVLHHIGHFLDLRTCRKLFELSTDLNQAFNGIELRHPEFWRIDFEDLINRFARQKFFFALEKRFFSINFSLFEGACLEDLYRYAQNSEIETIKLNGRDADLGKMLSRLDREAAAREKNADAPAPLCKILLSTEESAAPEDKVVYELKNLQIVSLSTSNPEWLKLTPHMPALDKLCIRAVDEQTLTSALAARTQAISWIELRWCKLGSSQGEKIAGLVERLQVKHLTLELLKKRELQAFVACGLETLRLVDNFDDDWMFTLDEFLRRSTIRTLILSDDDNSPRQVTDLLQFADRVKGNSHLSRLEVRVDPTRVSGDGELLAAVIGNTGIRFASLPYPSELQNYVDEAMAADPNLTIRRTNDYTEIAAKLADSVANRKAPAKGD